MQDFKARPKNTRLESYPSIIEREITNEKFFDDAYAAYYKSNGP